MIDYHDGVLFKNSLVSIQLLLTANKTVNPGHH